MQKYTTKDPIILTMDGLEDYNPFDDEELREKVVKAMEASLLKMVATGFYINVYDDKKDIFVILNEPNDEPTPEEVTKIEEVVRKDINELENLDLNCLKFGYQIIEKG